MPAPHGLNGGTDLIHRLRGLPMAGTVLCVAAHPDDEEAGIVAYLARGLGIRTVCWSATRGEGGQNRIGPERDEALGILRTWESLTARTVDGGEALYGPFIDFGYCKRGEDALERWGRDAVVAELVRAVRLTQPSVVVSRWSGAESDGHGHHQAIGMAVPEAFTAAGDPTAYPDLGVPPWRPLKLYHSLAGDWQPGETTAFGALNADYDDAGFLRVDTDVYDPIAGRTYQEIAALAWNSHRSQAMGFVPDRGPFSSYYRLVRSLVAVPDREAGFFDGIDPTLAGLADHPTRLSDGLRDLLADAAQRAWRTAEEFRPAAPGRTGEQLLDIADMLRRVGESLGSEAVDQPVRRALRALLDRKRRAVEQVAAQCLGLSLECLAERAHLTPSTRVGITVRLWSGGDQVVDAAEIALHAGEGWMVATDGDPPPHGDGRPLTSRFELTVAGDAAPSTPYWLRAPHGPWRYEWDGEDPLGSPLDRPGVCATADVSVGTHRLRLTAPAVHREAFPGGFRELPPVVLPPIALEPAQRLHILPSGREEQLELQVVARSMRDGGASARIVLDVPDGWDVDPTEVALAFARPGDAHTVRFRVAVPEEAAPGSYPLRYRVGSPELGDGVVLRPVRRSGSGLTGPATEANCVDEAFVVSRAEVSARVVDAAFVGGLRYGYVPGLDEEILPSLERFGLEVRTLSAHDLSYADLGGLDAIVVGPHAYVLRAEVRRNAARLLGYVRDGGTLIVQVQGYGYEDAAYAPYPFRYRQPHDRVTRPDAPVTLLDGDHAVLRMPNEIRTEDFDGWVHDRGLYFFGEWDRRYTPVLACADPGDEPQRGGLLVAAHGRGTYVYSGYSFFRQIPAGVPGAIRLFANLLAIPHVHILERRELARRIELLSFLDDEDLYGVARLMSERWLEPGAVLCRRGDRGDELYVILDGEIEVGSEDEGRWRVQTVLAAGEVIGELAVLTAAPRSRSMRARTETRLLSMEAASFRALIAEYPPLAQRLLRVLAERLATDTA